MGNGNWEDDIGPKSAPVRHSVCLKFDAIRMWASGNLVGDALAKLQRLGAPRLNADQLRTKYGVLRFLFRLCISTCIAFVFPLYPCQSSSIVKLFLYVR